MLQIRSVRHFQEAQEAAREALEQVLEELPDLEVVICFGDLHPRKQCQAGWLTDGESRPGDSLVLWCPHTSFHNINGGHAKRLVNGLTPRERILATYQRTVHELLRPGR